MFCFVFLSKNIPGAPGLPCAEEGLLRGRGRAPCVRMREPPPHRLPSGDGPPARTWGPRSEDEEEQGLVPRQHHGLLGALHGAHLLWGGGQEGQRPHALLRARVAQVAALVLLPVALRGGQGSGQGPGGAQGFRPRVPGR